MKKILLILLLILPIISFSQVKVITPYYTVLYSEEKQQPLVVEYTVFCDWKHDTDLKNSRNGLTFYKNDSIKTSDDSDYYKNVWDKGHLAPAAHYDCSKESLKSTFSYLNCALQHQDLNRTTWKYLEEFERKLSLAGSVRVRVDINFNNSKRLPTGALIPSGFRKTIWVDNDLIGIWYFDNKSPKSSDIFDYKIK